MQDEALFLTEELREDYQRHLAIEEGIMNNNPFDDSDATGYVPPTAEEVRGPDRIDVGPLPEGYKETFQYGEGVGIVGPIDVETLVREADRLIDAVRGSIGWSPDFKSEPPAELITGYKVFDPNYEVDTLDVGATPTSPEDRPIAELSPEQGRYVVALEKLQTMTRLLASQHRRISPPVFDRIMDLAYEIDQLLNPTK